MRFPNTVDDLIAALDTTFPEVVASPGMSTSELMHASGQRSVVAYLKQWRAGAFKEPAPERKRGQGRVRS
jgi:hypothetical protein